MKLSRHNAALASALLLASGSLHAHGLWVEPGQGGYKIFFGEPEHNLREKKEELARFAALKAWKADGSEGKVEVKEDHLFAATGTGGFTGVNLDSPVREPKEGQGYGSGGPTKSYQYLRFAEGLEAPGSPPPRSSSTSCPRARAACASRSPRAGSPTARPISRSWHPMAGAAASRPARTARWRFRPPGPASIS